MFGGMLVIALIVESATNGGYWWLLSFVVFGYMFLTGWFFEYTFRNSWSHKRRHYTAQEFFFYETFEDYDIKF